MSEEDSKAPAFQGNSGAGTSMAALYLDAVPKFSGDDKTLTSSKWAQDLDDNAEIFQWTEQQKLIFGRRSLVGTAALWLKSEKAFKNWDELKAAVQKEFPHTVNSKEMHEAMAARKKHKDESCYQYMLVMKELGHRAKFPDYIVVQYIIDGIQDYESNKMILYGATSYAALKEKLALYEKLKKKSQQQRTNATDGASGKKKNTSEKQLQRSQRCYNCGDINHVSSSCPNGIKCFRCNKYGHIGSHCTEIATTTGGASGLSVKQFQPRNIVSTGGAPITRSVKQQSHFNMADCQIDTDSDNTMTVSTDHSSEVMQIQNKDYEFIKKPMKNVTIKKLTISALVDSGSDVNLMSYEWKVAIGVELIEDNLVLSGLGQTKVRSLGKVYVNIIIDGVEYKNVLFHIVNRSVMPFDAVLGQELLKRITMIMSGDKVTLLPERDDWMPNNSFFSDTIINIDHIVDSSIKQKVLKCVQEYIPVQVKEAPIELKIVLKDEVPVVQRPQRISLVEQKLVENQVQEWLDEGIVRVSYSEYSSPLVLVRKKDGTIRVCVDYRLLNKKMIKDEFPLPVISDMIDQLCRVKVFSVLDLKNGFFHLKVAEESIHYTSFVTHHGQFEFLRAPFGLSICPKYFMRFVSIIFRELISQGVMMIFVDDILILAKNEKQAVERLLLVLKVASEYGLQINWKKADLIKREIEYLGHIIKDGEIKPSPVKTDAVCKYPEPRDIKQLHSFIGLTSYFRKYIENYALIAKPLTDLLKKEKEFVFGDSQRQAFRTLKDKLTSSPVLKIFDPKLRTELHTDASSMAYCAILMQHWPDTGLHPVYYMSCKTNEAQSRYSSYELEAMAIVEGVKKFRHYLYGIHFKIITDCKAFEMTLRKKDLTAKVARWVLFLSEYDYEIEHRSGSRMRHADALSRCPYVGITTLHEALKQAQEQDEGLRAIKEILKDKPYQDYWIDNDILYKGDKKLVVIPNVMEKEILKKVHSNGHFSKRKMKELIDKEYYMRGLDKKIEEFIVTCIPCLLATRKEGRQEGFLHPIDKEGIPLDTIHLDHVGPLTQTSKQYNYILTLVDGFTKFVWLFPTKSTTSRETLNKLEIHQQTFGNPRRIITDKGTAFTSHEFAEYCKEENIIHLTTTTGVPRSNGQVERIHRIVISILTKLCLENPSLWYKHINKVQRCINSTFQRSIKSTPFELLTGAKMRTKEDIKIQELLQEEDIQQYNEDREELRKIAKEQILKVQDENTINFNKKRKNCNKYKIGDLAAIKRTQFGSGLKLKPKYLGPYRVVKVKRNDRYDLEKIDNSIEGPIKTSSSADYMKRWPECYENT